jgi:hypothetical protein
MFLKITVPMALCDAHFDLFVKGAIYTDMIENQHLKRPFRKNSANISLLIYFYAPFCRSAKVNSCSECPNSLLGY